VEGFWPIFFLAVILKIPVAGLLYLVWWAVHQTPEIEEAPPGADDHEFRRWRLQPRGPRDPRRGPHAPDYRRGGPHAEPRGRRYIASPCRRRVS